MRILHVARKFPDLIGGDASAVDAITKVQAREGHDVSVVTSNALAIRRTDGVYRVGPPQSAEDLDRVSLNRIRAMSALVRWARARFTVIRPDVIHAHASDLGFAAAIAARHFGIPSILTCHGLWFPVWGAGSLRGRSELFLLRRGRYAAITTVDRAAQDALRSRGFPRVVHVPNGVNPDEFAAPRWEPERFRFVFAGRHEPQKGLDVLVDAVSILRAEGKGPFEVLLIGHGSRTPRLKELVRASRLDATVKFLGTVERPALVEAYLSASAFVLPSRFEGFPISILEAWAAGLPVIATSAGGIPEVATSENAILVPPGDAARLAAAMETMLLDPDLRRRLGTAGRRLVRERFTWPAVAARYAEVYAAARAT